MIMMTWKIVVLLLEELSLSPLILSLYYFILCFIRLNLSPCRVPLVLAWPGLVPYLLLQPPYYLTTYYYLLQIILEAEDSSPVHVLSSVSTFPPKLYERRGKEECEITPL